MRSIWDETALRLRHTSVLAGVILITILFLPLASAQTQPAEQKPAEPKQIPQVYETVYLINATQQQEVNDIQTDLRNMLPRAAIYTTMSQNAISLRGSEEDLERAKKIIAELDRPRKVYRLTYTITDMDSDKQIGKQHFSLLLVAGGRTVLKQGARAPIVTGTFDGGSVKTETQMQYVDLGLSIDASLDGERLRSKVEQSGVSDEKPVAGGQNPVIRQTVLDSVSNLSLERPVALGSLDIPGSSRHEEITVVAELVH